MWNDWVANAKKMAADVDRKLNESVGMDADGNLIGSSHKTIPKQSDTATIFSVSEDQARPFASNTSIGDSAVGSSGAVTKIVEDDDDAWNDDFDFDDDNDDLDDTAVLASVDTPAKIESVPIKAEKLEANPMEQSTPVTPLPSATTSSTTTKTDESLKKEKPSPPLPATTDTVTKVAETKSKETEDILASTTPVATKGLAQTSSTPSSGEGGFFSMMTQTVSSTEAAVTGMSSILAATVSVKSEPTGTKETETEHETVAATDNTDKANDGAIGTDTGKSGDETKSTDTELEQKKDALSSNGKEKKDSGWDDVDVDVGVDFDDDTPDGSGASTEESGGSAPASTPALGSTRGLLTGDSKNDSIPATKESDITPVPASATIPASSSSSGGFFSNLSDLAQNADSLLTAAAKIETDDENANVKNDTVVAEESKDNDEIDAQPNDCDGSSSLKNDAPLSPDPTAEKSPQNAISEEEKRPSDPVPSATPKIATAGLFSNFTNLAKTPKETTSKGEDLPSPNPTSAIPQKGSAGGLFSNLTNLAQTADSMLTAAVLSGEGDGTVLGSTKPDNSGGWENEDDDMFLGDDDEQDEKEKEKIPMEANKTNDKTDGPNDTLKSVDEEKEESSSSFVKVSPSSSVSTPETSQKETEMSGKPVVSATDNALSPPCVGATPAYINIEDDPRYKELQEALRMREEQLVNKGSQLNELQSLMESRDEQYKKKIQDTKEEAKRRIQRAKERCEAAEAKLRARSYSDSDDLKKKQLIIDELMEEGQALAQKQSAMEKAVRSANAETRALKEDLLHETEEKEQALEKIVGMEDQIKTLKGYLASAREGESKSGKLESDLLATRADAEEKANTILSLQQRVKELMEESRDLKQEINATRKSAAHEAQQEKTSMRKEHNDLLGDLEQKIRTIEREAGVREDALRHEVSEIRKRWQDAVRRADALSMDIQSSTAPLLRQLESMERQSRLRTANAAELESRLRSELEAAMIENERLGRDGSEYKIKLSRLERSMKERDQEIVAAKQTIEEQILSIENLTRKEEKLNAEAEKRQREYERVEKLANEGVSRVRSEMTQTVVDSEERYRGQIEKIEAELKVEREKRSQLEEQVGQLLENTTMRVFTSSPQAPLATGIRRGTKPKKLHKAEGQAEILAGALGLGGDSDDSDSDGDDFFDRSDMEGFDSENHSNQRQGSLNSFAALEQLSSKLRTAEVELTALRKSLKESNETHQSLVEELGEARHAKEKLPLFEQKVKELTRENREMEQEIAGLKEDIADVRELYRTQLNVLLEEKTSSSMNNDVGGKNVDPTPQENKTEIGY